MRTLRTLLKIVVAVGLLFLFNYACGTVWLDVYEEMPRQESHQ